MARVKGIREAVLLEHNAIMQHGNWWQGKTLVEKNAFMLQNNIDTDLTFVFRNPKTQKKSKSRQGASGPNASDDNDKFEDCTDNMHSLPSLAESTDINGSIQVGQDADFHEIGAPIEVENPEYADTMIHAHKYMLLSASSVFWRMMHNLNNGDEILMDDMDPQTFKFVLRFIYTESTDVNENNVLSLLNASRKYELDLLTELCSDWLARHVTPENACMLLEKSRELDQENLSLQCLKIIQNHTSEAFDSQGFMDITQNTLAYVLSNDVLSIKEAQVFHFCSVWATTKLVRAGKGLEGEEIRKALGPALYKIRFPTLSMADFTSLIIPTGVLSKEDELTIFRCLSMGAGSQCETKFPTKPRKIPEAPKSAPPMEVSQPEDMDSRALVPVASTSRQKPEESSQKVVWGSKSSSHNARPVMKGFLLLSPVDAAKIHVKQRSLPAEFELTLSAGDGDPILICGMRLCAPRLEASSVDLSQGDYELPSVSIINLTTHEPLLQTHKIERRHIKNYDYLAYVDVKFQPIWLLEKEVIHLNIIYTMDGQERHSQRRDSGFSFKNFLSFASKAMKTNHYTCKFQVVSGSYSIGQEGSHRVDVIGLPHSPILGVQYDSS